MSQKYQKYNQSIAGFSFRRHYRQIYCEIVHVDLHVTIFWANGMVYMFFTLDSILPMNTAEINFVQVNRIF